MLRISVLILCMAVVAGCYPPSYYDSWNARSGERYWEWYDASYPVVSPYASPYYSLAPYPYWPFFFSLSYSDYSYRSDHPYRKHYRGWYPYPRQFDHRGHKRR
ncbi:MAG: hypothetical protein ACOYVJ_03000 [Nitrospirota bacterium]